MATDIGFALNYTNLYLIDVTPTASTPTWARLGQGITSVEPDDSDETSDDAYYDGEGVTETNVTGATVGYKFSGDRHYNNRAQNFVASLRGTSGASRRTRLRHVAPDGRTLEGWVTITDISAGGGEANEKGGFEFTAHFAGRPTVTEPDATSLPTAIAAAAVSVAVGASSSIVVTPTPSDASEACAFASSDVEVATVDDSGRVTGVSAGSCTVSCKSMVLPSVNCTCNVTVTAAA